MTENKQLELENKRLKEIIEDKIGTILKLKRKITELESYNHSLAQKLHRKLTKIIELEKENKQLQIEVLGQSEEIEVLSDENTRLKQSKYVYGIHGGSNDRK